jgi:glutathione synthase/RimK-type ligase-like ATP-grasp enzyme
MKNVHGRIFNFAPLTFILPSDYSKFIDAFMQPENTDPWICKPSASSCGRKIYLISDITELKYSS